MLPWIWKRTLRLFWIGCLVALGIVCTYHYSLVIVVPSQPVNKPLGVRLKGTHISFYRRALYQTTFNNTNFSKKTLSKTYQRIRSEAKAAAKPKVSRDIVQEQQPAKSNVREPQIEFKQSPEPEVKPDRYSETPILSSSVLDVIEGSEYLDERIIEISLSCNGIIYRDSQHAYGRCRNFTNMRFIDGSRIVALASFPGSGSTWARSALEQATGIYTGSVYCDNRLKSKGFVGEKVSSANVLAVKTHYPSKDLFIPLSEYHDPSKFKNITAVILLVRNPLDSIVSLWNWMHGGHMATAALNTFGDFGVWRKFVHYNAKEFTKLVHYWLEQANISSVLVIKYEDMLTDLATQLKKMLEFLQVPYSDEDVECVTSNKLESYHRIKSRPFDHYNPADRQVVLDNLMSVETLLNGHNVSYKDVLTHFQKTTI